MTEQKKQMPESAEGFLVQAYRLHAAGETDRALDLVFGWTDAMLKANRSSIVNRALELVNVNLLDEDLLVGIWSATFASTDAASRHWYRSRISKHWSVWRRVDNVLYVLYKSS